MFNVIPSMTSTGERVQGTTRWTAQGLEVILWRMAALASVLRSLADVRVEFLIIGGHAVALHGDSSYYL
jgi:hypothetical protein